ncbi:jg4297 [Pararge aegeria aegeria]|uniref:Jg4297 protein n=1 Tax=Pararge aegeria aegeria TaxID=348720 RepID=A0A8S4RLN0_9NEOP|nr:jg4297 [Pararge aegeria aegeria]
MVTVNIFRARDFYWSQSFQLALSMLLGLVAVFAVPSILRVLISSRRSNSSFTAYRRYVSTLLHTVSWFEHDFKPGSVSWKSLLTVRTRHIKASMAANLKGKGIVSQRDLALTQFGFIGFSVLKPDKFGLRQLEEGDWEAYNHFWRVIGHAIGIEDRYNLCRKSFEETRQVCQIVLDRVFTPCLANVPEYFEHMARSMLDGMWHVNPVVNVEAMIYWTKYLADVPGYIDTDVDRINLQNRIRNLLKGRSEEIGVDISALIADPLIASPATSPRLIYLHDYDTIEKAPSYQRLTLAARYKISLNAVFVAFYSSYLGRICLNFVYTITVFFMKYFPYIAFFRYGVMRSYPRLFAEDPIDNEDPKPNSEYYKPLPPLPMYKELLAIIW